MPAPYLSAILIKQEMQYELIKALDNNQKLLKILYNFYKSIEA